MSEPPANAASEDKASAKSGLAVAGDAMAPNSPASRLLAQPHQFQFFQAVRLLERMKADSERLGGVGPPDREIVRLAAHPSLSFPAAEIVALEPPVTPGEPPKMTVAFMGMHGPSGVLPRIYTQMLLRQQRDVKGPLRHAFRDWLDLFNHRLISLFARAWRKYRFPLAVENGDADRGNDPFTEALLSLVGLGSDGLRRRLRVASTSRVGGAAADAPRDEADPADADHAVDDFTLIHFAGVLSRQPRNIAGLEGLVSDYFGVPAKVLPFQGHWLDLDAESQTRLGVDGGNCLLGVDTVVGSRVWDVEGKFRVQLGPITRAEFPRFLPDSQPDGKRKAVFLLGSLTRLYAGADLAFDVQLVLAPNEMSAFRLGEPAIGGDGAFLGWNTWLLGDPPARHLDDAVFESYQIEPSVEKPRGSSGVRM